MKPFFIGLLLAITPFWSLFAQKSYHLDSSYVKVFHNTLSVRTVGVFKHQDLVITDQEGNRIKYIPKNPFSVGLGLSYEFLIGDIAIRLTRSDEERSTSRFDLQAGIPFRNHMIDLFVQRYDGFRRGRIDTESTFREDIGSTAWGLNYYYSFNGRKLPMSGNIPGNRIQKKSAASILLGGYFTSNSLSADTTLILGEVSDFTGISGIRSVKSSTLGLSVGFAGILTLPADFYLFSSVLPGFGISRVRVSSTSFDDASVKNSWKINGRVAVGKDFGRVYSGVVFSTDYFFVDIGDNHLFSYRRGMVKAVLGIRFNAKGTIFDKVLGPVLP